MVCARIASIHKRPGELKVTSANLERLRAALQLRKKEWPHGVGSEQAFRWIHREAPPWRMDQAGPVNVVGWWAEEPPNPRDLDELRFFMKEEKVCHWYLRWRPTKGRSSKPEILAESENPVPEQWEFCEGALRFFGRKDHGDSFGLFLDQRTQRQWVLNHAKAKRVLNLFSFTCGFSVAAAAGGASQVVSVDLSQPYLDWGRENFRLNDLDPEAFEFWAWDGLDYLERARKKGLSFDIVVCDPPSFSRGKTKTSQRRERVFRIDKEYPALVDGCLRVLAPGGCLFFSTNHEKWTTRQWAERLKPLFPGPLKTYTPGVDFPEAGEQAILKSFFYSR